VPRINSATKNYTSGKDIIACCYTGTVCVFGCLQFAVVAAVPFVTAPAVVSVIALTVVAVIVAALVVIAAAIAVHSSNAFVAVFVAWLQNFS
jgi:Na+/phosphate symporter